MKRTTSVLLSKHLIKMLIIKPLFKMCDTCISFAVEAVCDIFEEDLICSVSRWLELRFTSSALNEEIVTNSRCCPWFCCG